MRLYVVVGPPAAGKSTWVRHRARPGDITIDYDALAAALAPQSSPHQLPSHVAAITKAARQAAIDTALRLATECNVYVIHSTPGVARLAAYRKLGAVIVCVDPGEDIVTDRVTRERPWQMQQVARKWYSDQAAGLVPQPSKLPTSDASRTW